MGLGDTKKQLNAVAGAGFDGDVCEGCLMLNILWE
jgi:hypothetical protein